MIDTLILGFDRALRTLIARDVAPVDMHARVMAALDPPVENADVWLHRLPGAQLDVFDGAGTLPHAEVPARFCRAFETFLGGAGG